MSNIEERKRSIKASIEKLINEGRTNEAAESIKDYEKVVKDDIDIYSMKGIISINKGETDHALRIFSEGLQVDDSNFDLNYNIAYLYEQLNDFNMAYKHYNKALENCIYENMKEALENHLDKIKNEHEDLILKEKKKIAFFVRQGMDSFLNDIVSRLSTEYEIKKIIVTQYNQIEEGIKWADVCWFEWCDELIAYASKLDISSSKKLICRLHSYEAFTDYINKVNWNNVDKIIFVAEHIRDIVLEKASINQDKTEVIYNGIDLNKFKFKEREKGFNIAYIGYINFKKGPMVLLHAFKAIYDKDPRYKLFIAGQFQEERYILYFRQMIAEMNLQNSVFYEGWQNNINEWLEDKNYVLCTSVLEGNPLGIMEAMARGIKPLIHNFVGAKRQFHKYVWNTMDDCVKMTVSDEYNSREYREFIESRFSLDIQMDKILNTINSLYNDDEYKKKINHEEQREDEIMTVDNEHDDNGEKKDNRVEEYYDEFLNHLKKDRERENPRHTYLKNRISQLVKKGSKVLDLGCGIGITTEHINSLGVEKVIGVDLSPKLIDYARNTVKNVKFIVHDITDLELNEQFDVITLCDCMEHVPEERYQLLFNTIKKHLKPAGVVYISIPDPDYMNFIQKHRPDLMQIIDNSITFEAMNQLCKKERLKIGFFNIYGIHVGNEYNEYIIYNYESIANPWSTLMR